MSEPLTIPPSAELVAQIKARRQEIAELKKLLRVSLAAERARDSRTKQRPVPGLDAARQGGPIHAA